MSPELYVFTLAGSNSSCMGSFSANPPKAMQRSPESHSKPIEAIDAHGHGVVRLGAAALSLHQGA